MSDVLIPGAVTATFVPRPEDVGKSIYCRVRADNAFGFATRDAVAVGPVISAAGPSPPSGGVPNIADLTPQVDETLHVTSGIWAGYPAPTFAYEWHRVTVDAPVPPSGGVPNIADTTPQVSEILHVTAGTWAGSPAPTFTYEWHRVTSDLPPAAPSNTGAPNIADATPQVTETLHVTDGAWDGVPTPSFTYEWHRVTSDAVPPSGGTPNIADTTPQVDETLHVTPGTWAGTPAPTFGYEWFRVGTAATITSSATATNVENTMLAHTLTASEAVTWSLVGGADQGHFELSGSTLRWNSNTTKNYEGPGDADSDNAYVVIVRATNGDGLNTDQTITVTVTDVVESTLTFDFQADTSTIAGTARNSTAALTVTRAGTMFAERLDGVWTSFAANVARRTDKGLLIEEARTNVCLQSRTLTNASWVKTNCTALKDQIGIDGVANSASKLTATAANATCLLTTTIASSVRFQTAFVKRITGSGVVEMTQNGGTTWTAVTVTSSWTRVSVPSITIANPVVGFRIVTSGDVVAIDMVQNENGAYATSPVQTTTAVGARAADVIILNTTTVPIASWFNHTEGTLFAEGDAYTGTLPTSTVFQIDAGAATNLHYVGLPGSTAAAGGTTTASSAVGTFNGTKTAGANKSAWAYKAADMAGSFNGGTVVTDATGAMPAGLTTTRFGKLVAATMWSGYLRKVTYWPVRRTNADLVTITT